MLPTFLLNLASCFHDNGSLKLKLNREAFHLFLAYNESNVLFRSGTDFLCSADKIGILNIPDKLSKLIPRKVVRMSTNNSLITIIEPLSTTWKSSSSTVWRVDVYIYIYF